jgi:DNA-binding transcriptional regulator YiaG
MTITEIRNLTGLNKTKFAEFYKIPYRTLQDWEAGKSKPPAYVLPLLERCVKEDFKEE